MYQIKTYFNKLFYTGHTFLLLLYFIIYEFLKIWELKLYVSAWNRISLIILPSLFCFIVYILFLRITRSKIKASLLTSGLFSIIFFFTTWTDIFLDVFLLSKFILLFDVHRKILVFGFLFLFYVLFGVQVWKNKSELKQLSGYFTLLIFFLLVLELTNGITFHPNNIKLKDPFMPAKTVLSNRPDIYYIILDHYSSDASLKNYEQYDNSYFTNFLKGKGFYVAYKSKSNYNFTSSSLSSSLNSSYLNIKNNGRYSTADVDKLYKFIQQNRICAFLRDYGYIQNIYSVFTIGNKPGKLTGADDKTGQSKTFINSLLRAVNQVFGVEDQQTKHKVYYTYDINSFNFLDSLANTDNLTSYPRFVYAHTLTAHPPFVIDSTGAYQKNLSLTHDRESYIREVKYVNKRITLFVNSILSKPGKKPIIIIQSDHGSHLNTLEETSTILNAYYFPDKNYKSLYQKISPVNTFRIVLNKYFNANLSLLPDTNYHVFYPML